ncbi:hypothetical protein PNOK_0661100 [Pyrrhoderma noxium]|uniref:Uncharacterized protein n=1 Tax=Pyrrhoderma noxium TaxID=2282107 RepID=A0A286UF45_9AGAM|nr:hypothetical protein PNOK_0661100 [Pyrrhoderma noxium]
MNLDDAESKLQPGASYFSLDPGLSHCWDSLIYLEKMGDEIHHLFKTYLLKIIGQSLNVLVIRLSYIFSKTDSFYCTSGQSDLSSFVQSNSTNEGMSIWHSAPESNQIDEKRAGVGRSLSITVVSSDQKTMGDGKAL